METSNIPTTPTSRRYIQIFTGTLLRTLAVGFGIMLIVVIASTATLTIEDSECNIAVRTLHGELSTYAYDGGMTDSGALSRALARDGEDEHIKGVILDIDSPGGLPVAGEEVARQLERLTKPNAAVIRSVGASAAYWAATGADTIFASRSSDVGSIGVIVSFPDESEKNKRDGITYNEFASGKYKNLGTPTRPVTKEEKALLEEGIADIYTHFVEVVARARGMATETVRTLADGSSLTGIKAKEKGLVDQIGDIEDARVYIETQIGEDAVLCEPDIVPFF